MMKKIYIYYIKKALRTYTTSDIIRLNFFFFLRNKIVATG